MGNKVHCVLIKATRILRLSDILLDSPLVKSG